MLSRASNELAYLELLHDVLKFGGRRTNRTGVDTISIFGPQVVFDLGNECGFPLMTTKKVFWKGIVFELLWMLSGSSNVAYLQEHGVTIWNEWAKADYRPELGHPEGELGPVYGVQWRRWSSTFDAGAYIDDLLRVIDRSPQDGALVLRRLFEQWKLFYEQDEARERRVEEACKQIAGHSESGIAWAVIDAMHIVSELRKIRGVGMIDQIAQIVDKLRHHRDDRRIILSSWNVAEIDRMKLPPCHYAAQFLVDNDLGLHCIMSIRSWDLFLGGPFNIAQYALLTHMLAHVSGLRPKRLVINAGDAHIYVNHIEQVQEQLSRKIRAAPFLSLSPDVTEIDDFRELEQISLSGYHPHPPIKGEIAV